MPGYFIEMWEHRCSECNEMLLIFDKKFISKYLVFNRVVSFIAENSQR